MQYDNGKSNRIDWEFPYAADNLAKAAASKMEYRQSRVEWWEAQKALVMAQIRESGLEVNEGVGAKYSNSTGHTPQVMVRADLQGKLVECHGKIQQHAEAVRAYDGWKQILEAHPNSIFNLKHGDWLFFFGRD
jgi:hypothetical protein